MGFGKSEKGKLEMDIADVKVQLKRHTDKTTKQEVVTDIFVAWGHQQEKDSPLTVHEIAERFDKLYQDVGGPTRSAMAVEAQSAATHCASHVSEPGARTLTILTMPREPRVRYMAQQAARHLDRFLGVDCLGARRGHGCLPATARANVPLLL
ncbi:unnamed protein product [Effrenium voratum]|nr:unnamed protein product [Effrenium voratum]